MKKTVIILLLVSFGYAQSKDASITLYKDGYGLVRQPISVKLKTGSNQVTYPNLPDKIEPASTFLSMSEGNVIYQKFNRDVFDTFAFLNQQLGKTVTAKTTEGKSIKGHLVDVDNNWLSIRSKSEVHVLNMSEVIEISSENRKKRPSVRASIEWTVQSQSNGAVGGEIVYISGGFDWNTNYRLIIAPDERNATLVSQAVVFNNTDQDFINSSIELVEGDLKHRRNGARPLPRMAAQTAAPTETAFQVESSGDFVLYSLLSSLTIPRNESLTASLYADREVQLNRTYVFENNERANSEEPMAIEISFANGGKSLDVPLPAGVFQIYQRTESGGVIFAGEDFLPQTSVGENITVVAGRAFNVLGKRTVMNYDRKKKSEEATILLEIKNNRQDKVNARITEHIFGDWVMRDPSRDYRKVDAETIQFDLTLGASSTETVTYTYRKEWQ